MHLNISYFRRLPHRQAYALAWPMILANMSSPLMGIADTAMLGHLDSAMYLGAVAIGANILAFLFWMFNFLRMSTTSFIGRALGAGDSRALLLHLGQALLMALTLGLLLIACQSVVLPAALHLMAPDPALSVLAREYLTIRLWAAPAVLITFVLTGFFIGLQNARIPLYIALSSNILNFGLDFVFIVVNEWQSLGAAWASLIAEWTSCVLSVLLAIPALRNHFSSRHLLRFGDFFRKKDWQRIAQLNGDLLIRTSLLLLVFNFFTAQSGQIGHETLAANAILMALVLLQSFALDGYAHAVEAMGARAIGARDTFGFMQSCAAATIAAVAMAMSISLIYGLAQVPLVGLFTSLPNVANVVHAHYLWLLVVPLVSVWTYLLDGIFIGAGHTRQMRNAMLLTVFGGFIPLWLATRGLGNHGLWLTFTSFNFLRGASLARAFYTLTVGHKWC